MENNNLGHLMVDIETMGSDSYSAIVSIGAVEFNLDTGETGDEFHKHICLQSCLDNGLHVTKSTLYWWLQQNEEARMRIIKSKQDDLEIALVEFSEFVREHGGKDLQVWGNSARFDLGLLSDAYSVMKLPIPWYFRKERCIRTLVNFKPEIKFNTPKVGIEHDALDDCYFQIKYCTKTWQHLNKE